MSNIRSEKRIRRKKYIRKKINGSEKKPRVFVFRSDRYTYVGVANDEVGKVLSGLRGGKSIVESKKLGEEFAKKLKELKVTEAVFDRSGYKFHGRIKAIVEALREKGLKV